MSTSLRLVGQIGQEHQAMTVREWLERAWLALPRLRRECRVAIGVVGLS